MNISEVTRRNIVDFLLLREYPFNGRLDLLSFLKRIWDLSFMPSTDSRFENAEGDIWQHMVNNNDWQDDYLLYTYLGIIDCDDETFLKFLETCVHPIVVSDETLRSGTVSEFNKHLEPDGYILECTINISGRPIFEASIINDKKKHSEVNESYEIVLSFAHEDRGYVENVAEYLKANGVKVFYDKYEEVSLWGKDLQVQLDKVYRGNARYCVMFISDNYVKKAWASHERRSAFAKAIQEKEEYVLPVRFDDTEVPGLQPTIKYVDLRTRASMDLGQMIMQKLGRRVAESI